MNDIPADWPLRPGCTAIAALFPMQLDPATARVYVRLPAPGPDGKIAEVIHQTVMRTGVGTGQGIDGIDRGQFGPSRLLAFRRIGPRVVAEYSNPNMRSTGDAATVLATEQSHYLSTVWSGMVEEVLPEGALVVDLTGFLHRDAFGCLARLNKGGARFAELRELTLIDPARCTGTEDAIEIDTHFTFGADTPPPADIANVAGISGDPQRVTLVMHHSLLRLPEGYEPRAFDPRINHMWDIPVFDFTAPLGRPLVNRMARRFRLEKTDPTAARSTVRKPIVFHVDRAAPEPIRTALLVGAQWWAEAFDRAGFIDAYRVELLPEDADPMESRWNLILWNDLQTPGWAFGQSALDPRTGEILRAIVYLCSQRLHQIIILLEAVMGAEGTGQGGPNDPLAVAMSRIAQLSAHETGHSLGFSHNFIGSAQGWTTVMDYPTPKFAITDGNRIDASDAYPEGIGDWDAFTVDALYGDDEGREERIRAGVARLGFGTDADGRIDATGMAYNAPWDRGDDPVDEMYHVLRVRRLALDGFGLRNLPQGLAVNELRRRLVPLFLYHRFQINAVAKLIGGLHYGYPVHGGGDESSCRAVAPDHQRAALQAMLATLDPDEMVLTDAQLALLGAQQSGVPDPQEQQVLFPGRNGRAFDPEAAAETAAELSVTALLAPERVNRLVAAEARGGAVLTLDEVLTTTIARVFAPAPDTAAPGRGAAARAIQLRLALMLGRLVTGVAIRTQPGAIRPRTDPPLSPDALAVLSAALQELAARLLAAPPSKDPLQTRFDAWLGALLSDRTRLQAELTSWRYELRIPPGEPI